MITTQKEKAFAVELKVLMRKYGVSIEDGEEGYEKNYRFSGPSIDVTVEEFEIWRRLSRDSYDANSNTNIAA